MIDLSQVGRNEPCPCGSGHKYKKCCWPKISGEKNVPVSDEEKIAFVSGVLRRQMIADAREQVDPADRTRIEEILGESGVKEVDAGEFIPFVQPLLGMSRSDPGRLRIAVNLGLLCWKLALVPEGPQRDETLERYLQIFRVPGGTDSAGLRRTLEQMAERHKQMFPHLHRDEAGARS